MAEDERPTMRTLNDAISLERQERQADATLIRQEQKTEHIKTRAIVIIGMIAGNAKGLSFLLGYTGLNIDFAWWRSILPW